MVRRLSILLCTLVMLMPALGLSAPDRFTYQGQIIKPDGQALEGSNVTFTIDLIDPSLPDSTSCVLYSEQHTLNMTGSNGVFEIEVGSGVSVATDYAAISTVGDALSNAGTITAVTGGCVDYTPGVNDGRQLRLTFEDGSSGPITITQNHDIVSVPYAYSAASINGLTPADLLNRDTTATNVLTQANLVWLFETARYTELQALINGTSTQYLSGSITSDISLGTNRITNLGPPTAGTDATNRDYVDQNIGGNTASIGTLGPGNDGQVLTWDGSAGQFVASLPTTIDATKLPLAGGTMTGPIDMGAQDISNGNDITIAGNMIASGGISTSGTLAFYNGSDYVGFQAGASPSNQIWVLPDSDGTIGQVLTTDGSGNLAWANDSSPVTSVFSRTGAIVAQTSDYTATQIDNTPSGDIAATSVQGALNELDSEKLSVSGDNMSGALTMDAENEIRFADNAGGEYVGFKAPNTVPASFVWDLPASDGLSGQVLTTNGSGALSFTSVLTTETQSMDDTYNNGSNVTVDTTDVVFNLTGTNNFQVQDAGSPALLVDGSGNVGVGTVAATETLDVIGTMALRNNASEGVRIITVGDTTQFRSYDNEPTFRFRASSSGGRLFDLVPGATSQTIRYGGTSAELRLYDNIAGTNRLVIDPSGRVGIGSSSPVSSLDVNGVITGSSNIELTDPTSFIELGNSRIQQRNGNDLILTPHTGGGVGIGTTSAGSMLDVRGDFWLLGATSGYSGFRAPATAGNNVWTLPAADGTSGQVLQTDGSGILSWVTQTSGADDLGNHTATTNIQLNDNWLSNDGGAEGIRIDNSGFVGIGTTTPGANLEVYQNSPAADQVLFRVFTSDDVSRFSVDEDGDMNLDGEINIQGNNNSIRWNGTQFITGNSATGLATFGLDPGVTEYLFNTAGTEAMRVNSSGYVGINNSTPSERLDVTGNMALTGNIYLNSNRGLIGSGNNDITIYTGNLTSGAATPTVAFRFDSNTGTGENDSTRFQVRRDGIIVGRNGNNSTFRMLGFTSGYSGFRAPDTAGDNIWTLPTADGTSGQALITDGSGNLSWFSVGAGSGDFMANGSVAMTGQFDAADGNASAPGISFASDQDTGIYPPASGQLAVALNGSQRALFRTDALESVFTGGAQMNLSATQDATRASFAFVGDNNTGMFRPSTDNVAFTTGGTEAMRIDASGNVGIGTNSPQGLLDINGSLYSGQYATPGQYGMYYDPATGLMQFSRSSDGTSPIRINTGSNALHVGATLVNRVTDSGNNVEIDMNSDNIAFGPVGGPAQTTFDIASGNVGIGTTTPGGKLDVNGDIRMLGSTSGYSGFQAPATAGNNVWTLPTADGTSGQALITDGSGNLSWTSVGSGSGDLINGGNSGAVVVGSNDSTLRLEANGSSYMAIATTGHVGIGTTNPSGNPGLEIYDATYPTLELRSGGVSHGMTSVMPTDVAYSLTAFPGVGGAHIYSLNDSGTFPGYSVSAYHGSATPTASIPAIRMSGGKKSGTGVQLLADSETLFALRNYNVNVLTVMGSGNFGIGTTTPGGKLDVNGDIRMLGINIWLLRLPSTSHSR
jgi:hypothetical protein